MKRFIDEIRELSKESKENNTSKELNDVFVKIKSIAELGLTSVRYNLNYYYERSEKEKVCEKLSDRLKEEGFTVDIYLDRDKCEPYLIIKW